MFKGLCIKQKSLFFILLLLFILLLTLYFQNRYSNKNYLIQLENSYKKSFDNYHDYFKSKLLEFYSLEAYALVQDEKHLQSLLATQKHLKSALIKPRDELKEVYKEGLQKGALLDVFATPKGIFYKLLAPLKKEGLYAEFILDTRVLLQNLKSFDGSNGLFYIIDDNHDNDVHLEAFVNTSMFNEVIKMCKVSDPVFQLEDKFYVKKQLVLKDITGEHIAHGVFFLDITPEKKAYISVVRDSLITSIVLFILAAIVVNYFFNFLILRIQKNEKELTEINKNLEQTVELEINQRLCVQEEALREKERSNELLMQHSKLAMLGEMIGNIAHQWRQPLMQLSAILMYLDAYEEKGKLTKERFTKKISDGNAIIDFMSKTIEDFRNYYKPEKQKEQFYLKQSIDSALFIVNSALKHANIEVTTTYSTQELCINSYKNEFSQALLNIITNAKDILIERKVKPARIYINAFIQDEKLIITIEDNAGGIAEENLEKVFDPYFTTKHKSQGTGIGLYMTKMIIENNMDGHLTVKNSDKGACFTISLT